MYRWEVVCGGVTNIGRSRHYSVQPCAVCGIVQLQCPPKTALKMATVSVTITDQFLINFSTLLVGGVECPLLSVIVLLCRLTDWSL